MFLSNIPSFPYRKVCRRVAANTAEVPASQSLNCMNKVELFEVLEGFQAVTSATTEVTRHMHILCFDPNSLLLQDQIYQHGCDYFMRSKGTLHATLVHRIIPHILTHVQSSTFPLPGTATTPTLRSNIVRTQGEAEKSTVCGRWSKAMESTGSDAAARKIFCWECSARR